MKPPRLCRHCSAVTATEENVVRLCADSQPSRHPPYDATHVVIRRTKRNIFDKARKGCPMCRLIAVQVRRGDLYDSGHDRVWLFNAAQKDILLWFQAAGFLDHDRYATHVDFKGLNVWCRDPADAIVPLSEGLSHYRPVNPSDLVWSYLIQMSCSARRDDPAAKYLTRRPFVTDRTSCSTFRMAQGHLERCLNAHNICPRSNPQRMPTRVVDVGLHPDSAPRIIETGNSLGQYAALSYVWGMKDQPVMALIDTVQALKTQLPWNLLPQTLKDGLYVARHLGIQYIWIDALCIIQDDLQDREREVGQMQHIFSNAHVTIVAANVASCCDGFLNNSTGVEHILGNERPFESFSMPFVTPDGEQGQLILQPSYRFLPARQPVNKRAWTLEERLLSPRLLIYGISSIVWQCQSGQWEFEDRFDSDELSTPGNERLPHVFFDPAMEESVKASMKIEQLYELRQIWTRIIRDYTARHLTHAQDRLRAISGIAARFQQILPKSQYLAGLWHDEGRPSSILLAQLLWNCEMLIDPQRSLPDPFAPSWSWASVEGSITWLGDFEVDDHQPGRVLDYYVEPASLRNPFGRVRGGILTLQAPLKRVRGLVSGRPNHGVGAPDAEMWLDIQEPSLSTIFKGEISAADDTMMGKTIEFQFAMLLKFGGLILRPTQQSGTFARAGMFHFLGPPDVRHYRDWESEHTHRVTKEYFHNCPPQVFTLV